MKNIHTPERAGDESFDAYKLRRKQSQLIADRLVGPEFHIVRTQNDLLHKITMEHLQRARTKHAAKIAHSVSRIKSRNKGL